MQNFEIDISVHPLDLLLEDHWGVMKRYPSFEGMARWKISFVSKGHRRSSIWSILIPFSLPTSSSLHIPPACLKGVTLVVQEGGGRSEREGFLMWTFCNLVNFFLLESNWILDAKLSRRLFCLPAILRCLPGHTKHPLRPRSQPPAGLLGQKNVL